MAASPWSGVGGGAMPINPVALARSLRPPVMRPRPLNAELAKLATAQRVGLPPRFSPAQQTEMSRVRLMEPSRVQKIVKDVMGTNARKMRYRQNAAAMTKAKYIGRENEAHFYQRGR